MIFKGAYSEVGAYSRGAYSEVEAYSRIYGIRYQQLASNQDFSFFGANRKIGIMLRKIRRKLKHIYSYSQSHTLSI